MLYLGKTSDSSLLSEDIKVEVSDFIGAEPTVPVDFNFKTMNGTYSSYTEIENYIPMEFSSYGQDEIYIYTRRDDITPELLFQDIKMHRFGTIEEVKELKNNGTLEYSDFMENFGVNNTDTYYTRWNTESWGIQNETYTAQSFYLNYIDLVNFVSSYTENGLVYVEAILPYEYVYGDMYGELEPIRLNFTYNANTNLLLDYSSYTRSVDEINGRYIELSEQRWWGSFDGNYPYSLDDLAKEVESLDAF